MAPPSLPKKGKVRLPENEELAGRFLEKQRSMMTAPGGLTENLGLVLSTAYRGLCASRHPIRTPGDMLRTKGIGPWVIRIMKDSFPLESSPDLTPQEGNTTGENGKKRKYVPRKNSAAYAIVITLYRYMLTEEGKKTARDCLARSGLADTAGPSAHHSVEVVLSDSDSDEPYPCDSDSDELAEGSAGNSLQAMPPCYSNENFREANEVVLILDD